MVDKYFNDSRRVLAVRIFWVTFATFIIFLMSGFFGSADSSGYGEVSLFESANASRNHRLDADITEHRGLFWQRTYTVNEVTLPDNTNEGLYDCTMKRYERVVCADIGGAPWLVEINKFRRDRDEI